MATIIDGKQLAERKREQLKHRVTALKQLGKIPALAVILVGNDPASQTYVRGKQKACETVGIRSELLHLPETTSEAELLACVNRYNEDPDIDGILVQLPLPPQINPHNVIEVIRPDKDVDGFHPINAGRLAIGRPGFLPCTPYGIMEMLKAYNIPVAGKHAVVIGRSNIVGKPMALLLQKEDATVTLCHSRTSDLTFHTRQADIVIAAVGRPHLVTADHVAKGSVVIDVGMNRLESGKLVGDVAFDEVSQIASYITPVPKGVGPMTITMLLYNTVESAEKRV